MPRAGSEHLALANGGAVDLGFSRIDSDTIEVRVSGGRRDRVFHVSTTGTVDDIGTGRSTSPNLATLARPWNPGESVDERRYRMVVDPGAGTNP